MDIQGKNFINELKKLKSIKADEGFKFDLRRKILEEANIDSVINIRDSRLYNQQASNLLKLNNLFILRRKNMFIAILLVAALLGGSAGTTYASQSSLPGDVLYPVKLASEKVQTVLVIDDAKEAGLHLKFSSKRLEEVDKLAQKGMANPELVKGAVDSYKKELSEVKDILNSVSSSDSDQLIQVARDLASATNNNKEILVKISGEVESEDVLDALKDAWKEAVEHNDVAAIELLKSLASDTTAATDMQNVQINQTTTDTATTATNATVTIQDQQSQKMVDNKIMEANHKISEAERYIAKKELKGADVTKAKEQIAVAKTLIVDAQNLLSQVKYSEAFLKAKEAHKAAELGKKLAKNKEKEHKDKDRDEDDDEVIFKIFSSDDETTETQDVEDDDEKEGRGDDRDADKDIENDKDNSKNDHDRGDNDDDENNDNEDDNDQDRN